MAEHNKPAPAGVDWISWPPKSYPCGIYEEFTCPGCGAPCVYVDTMSDDRDPIELSNFDFRCACGFYCRKFWNIPTNLRGRTGWKATGEEND